VKDNDRVRIHSFCHDLSEGGGFLPRAYADNGRVALRLRPEDKATLTRAASLMRTDLMGDIL